MEFLYDDIKHYVHIVGLAQKIKPSEDFICSHRSSVVKKTTWPYRLQINKSTSRIAADFSSNYLESSPNPR